MSAVGHRDDRAGLEAAALQQGDPVVAVAPFSRLPLSSAGEPGGRRYPAGRAGGPEAAARPRGANVQILHDGKVVAESKGPYGSEGYVYQAWTELPLHDGHYPVLGAWMVDGKCRGMGIREDVNPITHNSSRFVPHLFR